MKRKPPGRSTGYPWVRPRALDRQAAEEIAVAALAFLGRSEERLGAFLAASGLRPDTIRAAAADPGFFAGVLDHVAADEALLVAFAEEERLSPEAVMAARRVLSPVAE